MTLLLRRVPAGSLGQHELIYQCTVHFDGIAQDCSNSIANALESPQSCAEPAIWHMFVWYVLVPPEQHGGDATGVPKVRQGSERLHLLRRGSRGSTPRVRLLPATHPQTDPGGSHKYFMMMSSNGNIWNPRYWLLCGEFTGHRWIPLTKASDAELWCFLWSAPYQTVE